MNTQTTTNQVATSTERWPRVGGEYYAVEVRRDGYEFAEVGSSVVVWGEHYGVWVDRHHSYGQLFTNLETLEEHSWMLRRFREDSLAGTTHARIVKVTWDGCHAWFLNAVADITR